MSQHTPGPWVLSVNESWKTNPVSVVVRGRYGVHSTTIANMPTRMTIPPGEQQANARLVAAAPELLEALHAVQRLMDFSSPTNENYISATECFATIWDEAEAKVRAAIANATGAQSPAQVPDSLADLA